MTLTTAQRQHEGKNWKRLFEVQLAFRLSKRAGDWDGAWKGDFAKQGREGQLTQDVGDSLEVWFHKRMGGVLRDGALPA